MDDLPTFSCLEDELEYWKSEAIRYKEITNEVQQELHEFRECSEEIEKELESQLEQNEQQMKDLKQQNASLTFEIESLKERYEKLQADTFKEISDLQSDVTRLDIANREYMKDIRQLEQQNDDLDRTNRVLMVSLDDFEQRLNQTLERNAFLESELDEKDSLSVTVQRLHDEARADKEVVKDEEEKEVVELPNYKKMVLSKPSNRKDLRHELAVRQQKSSEHLKTNEKEEKIPLESLKAPSSPVLKKPMINGVHSSTGHVLPETPKIGQKGLLYNGMDKTPLTPSARISALNIVGDLLRKVGALESKLAACRNFVYEQPGWHSKKNSTRSRTTSESFALAHNNRNTNNQIGPPVSRQGWTW